MKTKFLTQLFLFAFVSFSLNSCTADTVQEDTGQASTISTGKPKTPTDVSLEEINTKPR